MAAKAPIITHLAGASLALGDECRVKDHLVVGDVIVTVDQKPLVLGVEHRSIDVLSGKLPNGVLRIPKRYQQEFGLPLCHPSERDYPAVPLGFAIFGQAGLVQIIEVALGVFRLGCATPGTSDHRASNGCTSIMPFTGATLPARFAP